MSERISGSLAKAFVMLVAIALAACQPEALAQSPLRTEFLRACYGARAYQSMKPIKRKTYCACIYDKTLSQLPDTEKPLAQFYILGQVGIDVRSKKLIDKPDMEAMVNASKAIGAAVKRCR